MLQYSFAFRGRSFCCLLCSVNKKLLAHVALYKLDLKNTLKQTIKILLTLLRLL